MSKGNTQAEATLKRIRKQEQNCVCPNCGTHNQFGFGNVCVKFKTFVCDNCKSSHQAISHRCKSVTMSTWNMEEVQELTTQRGGGNLAACHTWLLHAPNYGERYDGGGRRPQAGDKIEIFKQFVVDCYERQMFKSSTPFVPPEKPPHVAAPADSPIKSNTSSSARRSSGPSKSSGLVKATKSSAPVAPAVDLLDMGSAPDPGIPSNTVAANNSDFFNQPITAPLPAAVDVFSGFSSTTSQQQQQGGFGGNDFFSQPVLAAIPQQQQQQQQDFFMQSQQQQPHHQPQHQFDAFQQSMPPTTTATMPFNSFQSQQVQEQDPQIPQNVFQIQTNRPNLQQEAEFGGFESASGSARPKVEDKFSSFGGLVDLGNLTSKSEQEAMEAKKQAAMTSGPMSMNSFSGLDGFSRSPSSGSIMGMAAMSTKPTTNTQPAHPMMVGMGMMLQPQQQQAPLMSNGVNNTMSMNNNSMGMGMNNNSVGMGMGMGMSMNNNSMGMSMGTGMQPQPMNGGMIGMMNNGLQQQQQQQQLSSMMMGGHGGMNMNAGMPISVTTMNSMPSSGSSMNNGGMGMGGLPSPSSMRTQQYQQGMMMQQQNNNSFDGLRW